METVNNTYLSFFLGKELYGANVKHILEVLKDEPLTEIPKSKDFIVGIINFRGEVVTVIDLFKKLNIPETDNQTKSIVIVFELLDNDKNIKVGVLVNKVKKVFEMDENMQLPIPEFGKYYNPEYLVGVTKLNEEFVMLLNIEKVLSEEDVQLIIDNKI